MTNQPVRLPVRHTVTRRAILAGAPLTLAAVTLPNPAHAAAPATECLADILAPR